MVSSDRTRGSGHKLKHRRFLQTAANTFFTLGGTEHWHSGLPEEVVESPSLEMFRRQLDTVLAKCHYVALPEQSG